MEMFFPFIKITGRLYLTTTTKLIYDNILPLDLANTYDRELGCESSLGISLNSEIQSILKDTLKIYANLALVITGTTIEGVPVLARYTSYPNIDIDFRDFEFHENEEVNYTTVWRVFSKIYEFQKAIMDRVINPPTDEITAVSSMTVNYLDGNDIVEVQHNDDGTAVIQQRIRRGGM